MILDSGGGLGAPARVHRPGTDRLDRSPHVLRGEAARKEDATLDSGRPLEVLLVLLEPGEVENLRDLAWLRHLIPLEPLPNTAEWGFTRGVRFRAASFRRPPAADALVHLVKRYLAAFGPATRADLASWSGQLLKTIDPALESIRLRRFADEEGRELIDLPRAPIAEGDECAPIRFLSRWDELLIAHADRRRVLPEEHALRKLVLGGAPVVLVDGFVAGTWKLAGERVLVEPFAPLPRTALSEVDEEAARLAEFVC